MAKLHSYYVLCPLIDQKSFLGVAEDKDNDNVVVTLGRNVVNAYRLSDQKQVGGWTSKDHITSLVIYDKEHDSYVTVFNNNIIKMWKDGQNLEKLKKYKFTMKIHQIIERKNQSSLIILANGNTATLSYGIDNRKSLEGKSMLKSTDTISDVASYTHNNTDYICYVIQTAQDKYEIVTCCLRNELGDLERAKWTKEKVSRQDQDVQVVGKLISTAGQPCVYVMWSDSKMSAYDLINKSWRHIGSVPWISSLTNISIAWMGEKHLILFGMDAQEDGAIIVAYNVDLGVGTCRYPMKIYCKDAKLYCIKNRIILEAGNHIGMLPYALETERNLSSLLGSHEIIANDTTKFVDWGFGEVKMVADDNVKELLQLGLTERAICSQIITPLIGKISIQKLQKAVAQFSDVPESVLVLLIEHVVTDLLKEGGDINDKEKFKEFSSSNKYQTHQSFLKKLLRIPLCDAILISYLRNGLSLNNSVFLINFICFILINSQDKFEVGYESKLFDWCTLLLDTFYLEYLMTKDSSVTFALENLKSVIVDLIRQLDLVDSCLPLLNKILSKKSFDGDNDDRMLPYTIELIDI